MGVLAMVLNLIINGIPSIQNLRLIMKYLILQSFKPYYKWNTFNTLIRDEKETMDLVLNLIINGIPSIL